MIRKSIRLPELVIQAVSDYQAHNGLASWSQAAAYLIILGFYQWSVDDPAGTGFFGGDKAAESQLFVEYDAYEEAGGKLRFEDWLLERISSSWGGKREGSGRKF